jgi:glycosyltransferase involved in cell wall biosynthesis
MGQEPKRQQLPPVIIVTPGGLEHGGGIGRMIGYMLEAWSRTPERPALQIVDSRGPGHIIFSPLHFARCLATIVVKSPRRPLLHIQVAGRGSTIRKLIVVHLGSLLQLPMVLHLHDYNYRDSFQRFPKPIRLAARSMFRLPERVVVLSKADRDLVVTTFGVKPGRVEIVPNAVPSPARDRSTVSRCGPPHILFLGNPSRRKGVHDLIQALATEPLSNLDWRVTIAGGGGELEGFRKQVRAAGLLERVTFPGWVDRNATAGLLESADMVVLPSYEEGMAMSVLEGISYGLCVVSTPVGGLAEVVEDGISGLVVRPGDVGGLANALATCVAKPALRARLGAGAAERFAQKFDISRYPDRMTRIYEDAVGRGRNAQTG